MAKRRSCKICKKRFIPTRPWSRYCSDECRKEGLRNNLRKHRNTKQKPYNINHLTLEEMKKRSPYKKYYNNIINAIKTGKNTWDQLYEKSGIVGEERFNKFLDDLMVRGVVMQSSENTYRISELHRFEPIRLVHRDNVWQTSSECVYYDPKGYRFTIYTPHFDFRYLMSIVPNAEEKIDTIGKKLLNEKDKLLHIMREARDAHIEEFWINSILSNGRLHVLTKFQLALDMIFDINIAKVERANKRRSIKKQEELFYTMSEDTVDAYLRRSYPGLTDSDIAKIEEIIDDDYKKQDNLITSVRNDIIKLMKYSNVFENQIVLCDLALSTRHGKKLLEGGFIRSVDIDRNKSREWHDKKMEDLSKEKRAWMHEHSMKVPVEDTSVVASPFFKEFFQVYARRLTSLGFSKKSLQDFYNALDETANIIRIPMLPVKKVDLFKKG